ICVDHNFVPSYTDHSMVEFTIGHDDVFQFEADQHDFIRLQREDADFAGPLSVMGGGPLPKDSDLRKSALEESRNMILCDRLLYRVLYARDYLLRRSPLRLALCIPRPLRDVVMEQVHNDLITGGHLAVKKTMPTVLERYWWPTIHSDLRGHIARCHTCQQSKDNLKRVGPVESVPF
ncbi:hypothetical protein HDU67_004508, partial [Dinochytrium kinnereticum]